MIVQKTKNWSQQDQSVFQNFELVGGEDSMLPQEKGEKITKCKMQLLAYWITIQETKNLPHHQQQTSWQLDDYESYVWLG